MVKVCTERFPAFWNGNSNRSAGFYMHPTLKANLDVGAKAVRKNWDCFGVIDGPEGAGKSREALQIGAYWDPNFNLNKVVFSAKEFKDAVLKAKKYSCIVFDEAYGGLASRRTMSSTNHALVDMMAEMRQKNLFVLLVLPSFFELDKYAAVHRCRFLIHVYHKRFVRGYYRFYTKRQKKKMYLMGKRTYDYKVVRRAAFEGDFTNFIPVDEKAYDQKKLESFRATASTEEIAREKFTSVELAFYKMAKHYKFDSKILYRLSVACGRNKRYLTRRLGEIETVLLEKAEEEAVLKRQKFEMPKAKRANPSPQGGKDSY